MGMLGSMEVIENQWLIVSVQKRTHRKKRINKKWRKRYGLKQVPDPKVYVLTPHTIHGHPETISKLMKKVLARLR